MVKKLEKRQLVNIVRFGISAIVLGLLVSVGFVIGKALTTPTVEDPYEKATTALENHAYGEAYYYLNQELEVNPNNTDAYLDLEGILVAKNRQEEAVMLLLEALNNDVEKPRIRETLATLYLSQRNYSAAEEQFSKLVTSSADYVIPNKSRYYYNYYLSLLRQQKLDEAEDVLHEVRDKYSDSEWYYKAIYELILWEIDDPESRSPLINILSTETQMFSEELESIESRLDEAKDAAGKRDLAEQNGWYGIILLENERCELATPFFEKAIELGDTYGIYAKAHHYNGVCKYQLGEFKEAEEELTTALGEDPTDLDSWLYKAYTCDALKKNECAEEAFGKLITVDATNTLYVEAYADYLIAKKKYSEAFRQLQVLYNSTQDKKRKQAVAAEIVELAFSRNNFELAEIYVENMDKGTADYYAYKGRLKQIADNSNLSGKSEFIEALKIDAYHAEATYYLALVEQESGNREGAADLAAKAIDYDLKGNISGPATELLEEVSSMT